MLVDQNDAVGPCQRLHHGGPCLGHDRHVEQNEIDRMVREKLLGQRHGIDTGNTITGTEQYTFNIVSI